MLLQRWLYAWRVRLRALFDRDRADGELDEELQHHVALEVEERCARGVPRTEARRQALAALGGVTSTREHVRGVRFGAALGEAFGDLRYGLRLLRRSPGFAAAAVLTLTLAIGATATIFSLVDAVLIQPPPFPEPDRLVTLWQTDPENGDQPVAVAPATFLDWRAQARSFERVAAIEPYSLDFTGDGEPEVFYGSLVTEGFFEALGAGAAHGRTFLPEEFRPGSGVVIIAHGFWERRFGGDAGILGRSLTLDGRPYTVVGVLAPDFELGLERGRGDRDLYLPKAIAEYETHIRVGGWWHVIARVRPEVALAEAQAEMDAIAARLVVDHPRTNAGVGAQRRSAAGAARRNGAPDTAAALGRRGPRAADRLRQRREPDVGAIDAARAGVRHPVGGGRRLGAAAAPTADREHGHRRTGRPRRTRAGGRSDRIDSGAVAVRCAGARAGRPEWAAAGLRRRAGGRDRPAVRVRAGAAGASTQCRGPARERSPRRPRHGAGSTPRAGGGGGRSGVGVAVRCGSARPELRAARARRPGLRAAEHGGVAGLPGLADRVGCPSELLPPDPWGDSRPAGNRRRGSRLVVSPGDGEPHRRESADPARPAAGPARGGALHRDIPGDPGLCRRDAAPAQARALVRRT